jgi:2,4-dienoyl-CoA reductase-like NADH-dependent reductase (Old Yellow Enzyme family)/thioredoxin reductase
MSDILPNLFSPLTIRGHRFKNRIFSTGHMTVMLENGLPSDAMVAYHKARAEGGAGLIILEAARAHISGISSRPAIHAFDDACIDGFRRIAKNCHAHDCRIFGQLTHPGREMGHAADGTLAVAYAPSAIPNERFHVMPREMPQALIKEIVAGFGEAAGRMKTGGLDGVEVVASHGYLAAQFLNPRVNIRTDSYGGTFDNRLTFLREVLAAVREGAGSEMIVGIRLSGDELEHDGLVSDEVLEIAAALDSDGMLDYINVTAGSSAGLAGSVHIVPPMEIETAYTAPFAAAIKDRVSVPVFVAGRVNQPQIAEKVLNGSQADMCGMTRALISDPDMPIKAYAGRLDDIRACVACNQACIGHMLNGLPISCIQRPETGREVEFGTIAPATTRQKIMVAGGGPGGMKAAAVAAQRGHEVVLYEASNRLGGQVNLAQMLPGRSEFGGITSNLLRELEMADVTVELGTRVTRQRVEQINPDAVVVATGADPYQPVFPGSDQANVVDAWQVLMGERTVGGSVVIADWRCDWIGLGIANMLARNGSHVRLSVNGVTAGQMIPQYVRDKWLGDLHRLGVEVIPYTRLIGVDETDVYLQHTTSAEPVIIENVDTLVTALGHQSRNELSLALSGWQGKIHLIGDCQAPRTVEEAILEGLRIGVAI